MALRETLTRLNDSIEKLSEVSQSERREEWLSALSELFSRVEIYLADYVKEGSLALKKTNKVIREDAVGVYRAPVLTIIVGPAHVELMPVGRVVAGAIGRVDMHRQGRSRAQRDILLLRADSVGSDGLPLWRVHVPPPSISSSVGIMVSRQPAEIHDLDKNSFEYALDILLS